MKKKLLAFMLASTLAFSAMPAFASSEEGEVNSAKVTTESEPTDIKYTTESDYTLTFKIVDFEKYCLDKTGENLYYVNFEQPASSEGSLWYDYEGDYEEKVTERMDFYRNSSYSSTMLISNVTFVPKTNYSGKVEIPFTGYTSTNYKSFTGKVVVTVEASTVSGDLDKITYDIAPGGKLKISADDINRVCRNSGFMLSYVMFELPSSTSGTLYYDYSASDRYNIEVDEDTKFYRNSSGDSDYMLNKVTFVAAKKPGKSVEITYYAYSTDDTEYTGVIRIRFDAAAGATYETNGEVVFINASDINNFCMDQTGSKVSYVKFDYPSRGTLYYDYDEEEGDRESVWYNSKYYYNKSPYLYLVGYVPEEDYNGTVIIDYEAFNIDGDSCNGSISIKVDTENVELADDITYSVRNDSYITFSASDFNTESRNATGEKLDYIRISDVSNGYLYYKYDSYYDDYENERITTGGRYYYDDGDRYIKYISYVPGSGYTGTAVISYTGYTVDGTGYKGEVRITVRESSSSSSSSSSRYDDEEDEADDIKYSGSLGGKVYLVGSDFNSESRNLFREKLEYIKFKLPSSSAGVLYYGVDSKLKSSTKCYYNAGDEIDISDVYFVPNKVGKITLTYSGLSEDDDSFVGSVIITVTDDGNDEDEKKNEPASAMSNFKYITSYRTSLFTDIDESAWYGAEQTGVIKSAYRYGFLKGKGDKIFDPTGSLTVAEAITIAARIADTYYEDETKFSTTGKTNWYDDYVDYAVSKKIIGKSDFVNYNKAATRAEMAYIFANVLPAEEYSKKNSISSLPDVKTGLKYYDEIMRLYSAGILTGNDEKGTFAPSSNITRAEVAAIVVRIVDTEERRSLSL